MPKPKLTWLTTSLSTFSTFSSKSMTYWTKLILSTSNVMIKTRFHTGSSWATMFGYICRRSISLGPIASFARSDMVLTPSLRLWETMIWAQHSLIPWPTPSVQCGSPSAILSTITGHIKNCRTTHTKKSKPRLHGTDHNWFDHGHVDREHSPAEDPIISCCQSWQILHQGKWLTKDQVQQKFPHLMGALNTMGTIAS